MLISRLCVVPAAIIIGLGSSTQVGAIFRDTESREIRKTNVVLLPGFGRFGAGEVGARQVRAADVQDFADAYLAGLRCFQ
jgi:hypothetical protein